MKSIPFSEDSIILRFFFLSNSLQPQLGNYDMILNDNSLIRLSIYNLNSYIIYFLDIVVIRNSEPG